MNTLTTDQFYQRLNEALIKMPCTIKESQEKYNRSALFNQTIHALAAGADPYALIDQLITIIETLSEEYKHHMERCATRMEV